MKNLLIFLLAWLFFFGLFFALAGCSSTEKAMQRKGFRPYVKKASPGYRGQTENFSGYGTYRPPRRKGVDL